MSYLLFLLVLPALHMRFLGRRYDPDEIEEEQRERERRNQINRQFNQYVKRVQQDIWERDYGCEQPLACLRCCISGSAQWRQGLQLLHALT